MVPIIPIVSIISCLFLITQLSSTTLQRFAISLIIGVSVYLVYGMRKSKLNNPETDDLDDVKLITDPSPVETDVD